MTDLIRDVLTYWQSTKNPFESILTKALTLLPNAQAGSILVKKSDQRFHYAASVGFELQKLWDVTFSEEEVLFQQSQQKTPFTIEYISEQGIIRDQRRKKILETIGKTKTIIATLIVPVWDEDTLLASLTIDNFEETDAFSAVDIRRADILGIALLLLLKNLEFQRSLDQAAHKIWKIFEHNPVPALTFSEAFEVQKANHSLARLLELDRTAIEGMSLKSLVDRHDYRKKLLPTLHVKAAKSIALKLINAHKQPRTCLGAVRPLSKDMWLLTLVDVTEQRHVEEEVSKAIEAVFQNSDWIKHTLLDQLAKVRNEDERVDALQNLTPREQEVLSHVASGEDNQIIAQTLSISRVTVRNYLQRIYSKLGVHSRGDAIIWARKRGIIADT